jgi:fermentation-respiration switch protein FrsA (DUF1100 family)
MRSTSLAARAGRWLVRAALVIAAIPVTLYLLALAALWFFQDALLYPGWAGPAVEWVEAVPGLEEVSVPGETGALRGWWRPPGPGQPTVAVFHGNAGFQWMKLHAFAERDWGILMVAYRGFAGNAGTPSEAGLVADGRAALDWLAARGVAPGDTVLWGESLGTGVATRVALSGEDGGGDWRALVLDAPYTSLHDRAEEMYGIFPVRPLMRDEFDTAGIVGDVSAPILILHGTADRVIPAAHGRALAAMAPDATLEIVEGGTHFLPPQLVAGRLERFLEATE